MFHTCDIQRRFYDLPELANTCSFRSPWFWHEMRLGDSLRLLGWHRFQIHPLSEMMAAAVLGVGPLNTQFFWIQTSVLYRLISSSHKNPRPSYVMFGVQSSLTSSRRTACPLIAL